MSFWKERFSDRIYELKYETLIENQEEETRMLLQHCELDWEDQCLDFDKTERVVKTASSTQVRLPMHKGSSQMWKNFEPYLKPLLEGLGAS
jgi:hypothetical protein